MNGFLKNASLWIILLIFVVLAVSHLNQTGKAPAKLGVKDFTEQLAADNIKEVRISPLENNAYNFNITFKAPVQERNTMEFNG